MRQAVAEQPDGDGHDGDQRCKAEIALPDRFAFGLAIFHQRLSRQFVGAHGCKAAEDHHRTHDREDGRAERVERLGEGKTAVRRAGRAEQRDQRIGHDLDDHDPAGEDEQRAQEDDISRCLAGGDEEQAADHHGQETRDRAAHIAQLLDQLCTRNADDEVGCEEAELHQHRFGPAEREELFQFRDDDIV